MGGLGIPVKLLALAKMGGRKEEEEEEESFSLWRACSLVLWTVMNSSRREHEEMMNNIRITNCRSNFECAFAISI
jgi:hypothetical protein